MKRPLVKLKSQYSGQPFNEGDLGLVLEFDTSQTTVAVVLLKSGRFSKISFSDCECVDEKTISEFLELNKKKLLNERKE
jgi:hypothetical protein